ncbi:hypothetical protein [Ekhidna sp.]|uniref:NAD(P)H-dependent amine dehydrogenase family protein n=1 Tax=Ekhidna sp. TaxID=2608089 RepID=UPI003BAD3B8D
MKILQVGMGPLGQKISEFIEQRSGLQIVGAIDTNPQLIGSDLGSLNTKLTTPIKVVESIKHVDDKPDVIILTTTSTMESITPQILELLDLELPIVSTCEELSYPWICSPDLSKQIDDKARKKGVAVLGVGVNPGFLMDALPSFLTAVCQSVESIKVDRVQDASQRRLPFQKKIGAGLSQDEFAKRKSDGSLRHVGLTESIQFIATALGLELDRVTDEISPLISENGIKTKDLNVEPNFCTGVRQIGTGYLNGKEIIKLNFIAGVGIESSYDSIEVAGNPNIKSTIEGGVNGDIATCAITVNAIYSIVRANPGLRTVHDVPLISRMNGKA